MLLLSFIMANNISAEKLNQIIASKEPLLLIDVRTEQEYYQGTITGSINVPFQLIEKAIPTINQFLEDNPSSSIVLFCRTQNRAREANRVLKKHNITPTIMFEGIMGWSKKYGSNGQF